eukprot:11885694-Prorocentrum_lima.AAC.1
MLSLRDRAAAFPEHQRHTKRSRPLATLCNGSQSRSSGCCVIGRSSLGRASLVFPLPSRPAAF